mmetsp:Transcript_8964/g.29683  ORF Transcript_8964/g.29683 Transcript_8964/m.29683 type:complete len:237 (+) Transcript_8964:2836-3546(+)
MLLRIALAAQQQQQRRDAAGGHDGFRLILARRRGCRDRRRRLGLGVEGAGRQELDQLVQRLAPLELQLGRRMRRLPLGRRGRRGRRRNHKPAELAPRLGRRLALGSEREHQLVLSLARLEQHHLVVAGQAGREVHPHTRLLCIPPAQVRHKLGSLRLIREVVHNEALDDGPAESLLHARRVTERVVRLQLHRRRLAGVFSRRDASQSAPLAAELLLAHERFERGVVAEAAWPAARR